MSIKPRKSPLSRIDDEAFIYAALFTLCALISAIGGGPIALIAVVGAGLLLRHLLSNQGQRDCNGQG